MELLPIDQTNWREASKILVTDEQLRFVAAHQPVALVILAKAFLHVDERVWEPFALSNEASHLCGVVALVFDGRLCEIFHLAIDYRLQGRGYGSLAMTEIVRYATHNRGCDELKLTVHPENEHAQHIYARAGFLRNGQERHGEPVWVFTTNQPPPVSSAATNALEAFLGSADSGDSDWATRDVHELRRELTSRTQSKLPS